MQIKVVRKERISPDFERWWICLSKENFRDFGFLLEAMEGVGVHRRSHETDNQMEVEVSLGMMAELEALLEDMREKL